MISDILRNKAEIGFGAGRSVRRPNERSQVVKEKRSVVSNAVIRKLTKTPKNGGGGVN